jgi:hypothetical protein
MRVGREDTEKIFGAAVLSGGGGDGLLATGHVPGNREKTSRGELTLGNGKHKRSDSYSPCWAQSE